MIFEIFNFQFFVLSPPLEKNFFRGRGDRGEELFPNTGHFKIKGVKKMTIKVKGVMFWQDQLQKSLLPQKLKK